MVNSYATRGRSIPDVNDDWTTGAELLRNRGRQLEIDGPLVDLENGSKTMNIVLKRCFSKYFAEEAITEQNRGDASGQGR